MYEADTALVRAQQGVPRPPLILWPWVFVLADAVTLAVVLYINRHIDPRLLAAFAAAVIGLFAVAGMYRPTLRISVLDQGPKATAMISVAAMIVLTVDFLTFGPSFDQPGFVVLWFSTATLMFFGRVAALPMRLAVAASAPKRRTVIIGSGTTAVLAAGKIDSHPDMGLEIVGFIDDGPRQSVRGRTEPLLGPLGKLESLIDRFKIEAVVLAFVKTGYGEILRALYRLEPKVDVLIIPRYFEYLSAGITLDALGNLPVMRLQHHNINRFSAFLKRTEDLGLAVLMLAITAPLWLLIAIAIKLDSPGPVFYSGLRIGRDLVPFKQLKFRTMHAGAENDRATIQAMKSEDERGWKLKDDPRITRMGRLLRKTSMDELPQLLNVIIGDMSFVGPRPPSEGELEAYDEWQRKRLTVRPGITGMWQVSGRSELPFDERIWLDFLYIDTWSIWLDFKIMVRTVGAVLTARGAY